MSLGFKLSLRPGYKLKDSQRGIKKHQPGMDIFRQPRKATTQIRALGTEGMIQNMLQYLNVAENMLWHTNSYQRSDLYYILLHALVKAKEIPSAIEVFKNMRICGFPASVATYNIMIECCSLLKCFKSACGLVSTMLRHGFFPQRLTYTALTKVLLANDDFDGALSLLEQSSSDGIQPDIQLSNMILEVAYIKGGNDIIEYLATALLNLRWRAIAGLSISWLPEESQWAQRLSSCYGARKGES